MTDRSLAALGLAGAPAELPLTYPGRPVTEPALLTGGELLPLRVAAGARLGAWTVVAAMDHPRSAPDGDPEEEPELDRLLGHLGLPAADARYPVVAVGSNASPAQLHHKLDGAGLSTTVPMVPVLVRGLAVGCSGHIGRHGYVAATPYADPAGEQALVISWLDGAQLAAVDATELNYRRVLLPGTGFPMAMPSGERLAGAYLYVSSHGVLTDPATGLPRPGGGDQRALLTRLLAGSAALRRLLGPGPEVWVARAAADPAAREAGKQVFRREGWVRTADGLPAPPADGAAPADRAYGELPPLLTESDAAFTSSVNLT
ncbi:hypothetical protein ACFQ2B_37090 [Streptomyces stramineus]|uniref:hypothetical protein n=1 Tax=Streptomyces TaxID=1883 RepID=UPI0031CFD67A